MNLRFKDESIRRRRREIYQSSRQSFGNLSYPAFSANEPNSHRLQIAIAGNAIAATHNNTCRVNGLALLSQIVSELFNEIFDGNKNGNIDMPKVNTTMATHSELANMAQ